LISPATTIVLPFNMTFIGGFLIGISRTEGTFIPKEKWGLFGVNFLYFISPYHRLFKDVNAI